MNVWETLCVIHLFTWGQNQFFQCVCTKMKICCAPLCVFVAHKDKVFQAFPSGLWGYGAFGVYIASPLVWLSSPTNLCLVRDRLSNPLLFSIPLLLSFRFFFLLLLFLSPYPYTFLYIYPWFINLLFCLPFCHPSVLSTSLLFSLYQFSYSPPLF